MPTAPQRNARKKPTDYTGVSKEAGESLREEELAEAAERMTMVTATQAVRNAEVVDYTDESRFLPQENAEPVQVQVKPQKHKIRVLADIDDMTFGKIYKVDEETGQVLQDTLRRYDFQEGREYIVDHEMYEHLKSLGYLWE